MSNNIGNLRINGINPLSYMGVNPYTPTPFFFKERRPTTNDSQNFILGTLWLYTITTTTPETFEVWMLVSLTGGIATWIELYPGVNVGTVRTLTGNTGLPVSPDIMGNINTIGDISVGITVAGNPGTNTTTITSTGGGPFGQTITGNTGGPVRPDISGNWNVVGDGTGITIAGTPGSHLLTASLVGGGVASQKYFTDVAGPVVPNASGEVNVFGAIGIVTSGAGNTLTISGSATGTTMTTGTYTPSITVGGSSVGIVYNGAENFGSYVTWNYGALNYVAVFASLAVSSIGALTGDVVLTNLPFTISAVNFSGATFSITIVKGVNLAGTPNAVQLFATSSPPTTSANIVVGYIDGTNHTNWNNTQMTFPFQIGITILYRY